MLLRRRDWMALTAGVWLLPALATQHEQRRLFGSPVDLLLPEGTAPAASSAVWRGLQTMNDRWNAWKPGEVTALNQAFAQVARLKGRVDPEDTDTIHRTRVTFKQFRYMVEALAPLLAGASAGYLAALHDHQRLMGDIQDAEVFQAAFDQFASRHPAVTKAVWTFRAALAARRRSLIASYLQAADDLDTFWPPPGSGFGPVGPTS